VFARRPAGGPQQLVRAAADGDVDDPGLRTLAAQVGAGDQYASGSPWWSTSRWYFEPGLPRSLGSGRSARPLRHRTQFAREPSRTRIVCVP
jgi:hypothetical protein